MNETIAITEKALLCKLGCPLRTEGLKPRPESSLLESAENTARWLISEIAAARKPSAGETREYYDLAWQQTECYQSRDDLPPKKYDRLLLEGLQICYRLRDCIWSHEIVQPVKKYELPVGNVVIRGEYSVVSSPRRKRKALVLYWRYGGVKLRPLIPDVVSFARLVDVANRSAARDWGFDQIGILHYWIDKDLQAEHRPDLEFANNVLLGAAGVVSGAPFPIPGKHCLTCLARSCTTKYRDTLRQGGHV